MAFCRNRSICPVRMSQTGRNVTSAPWAYSEEPWMLTVRIVLAAAVVAASCASCADRTGAATPTNSAKPSESIAASPTQVVPPYLSSYTAEERATYVAALRAHAAFVEQDRKFAAVGKTTQRAAAFYRRNSIDWVSDWASLAQLANNHVIVRGRTIVKWVRPVTVQVDGAGADVVVLRRCVDSSGLAVTQNGKPLAQPNLKEPHVFRVRLEKRAAETWWRVGTAKQGAPC